MTFIDSLIGLLFLIGIILLQIYLSKKQNKWVGLILPGICLIFSILAVLGMASFSSFTKEGVTTIKENGEVVKEVIRNTTNKNNIDLASVTLSSIIAFLMYNISTAILIAIYVGCRKKMNIQDLE